MRTAKFANFYKGLVVFNSEMEKLGKILYIEGIYKFEACEGISSLDVELMLNELNGF